MSTQGFEFLDTESGNKLRIQTTNDVLQQDVLIKFQDTDGTVALSKDVEDLRSKLADGTIIVKNSEKLGDKQATEYALANLSNVDLQGLNIGSGNSEGYFNVGDFELIVNGPVPALNSFIEYLTKSSNLNTIDASQKIDNSTFLLKAGRTYKIEGGLISFTATSGTATTFFKLYNANTSEEIVLDKNTPLYSQTSAGTGLIRNFVPNFYYTPTVDVHLKLQVTGSALVDCTYYTSSVTITEYISKDIALLGMKINGKSFDNNNNVDLEGISTLANNNTTETLTEKRWIDGKPIYRKIVNAGLFNANTTVKTVNHNIVDTDNCWVDESNSFALSADKAMCMPLNQYNTATNYTRVYLTTGNINLINSGNYNGFTAYVSILYTKTSDTINSPVRLVGTGNGTAGIISELPALTGSEGKLLRVNQNGQLEWFDNSFVGCSVIANVATNVAAGTNTLIKFNDSVNCKVYDTHNAFDFVNSKFIAPVTGYYEVIGKIGVATASYNRCNIYKNNVLYCMGGDSTHNHSMVNNVVYLVAGDSISLYGLSTLANTTYGNGNTYLTITLKK